MSEIMSNTKVTRTKRKNPSRKHRETHQDYQSMGHLSSIGVSNKLFIIRITKQNLIFLDFPSSSNLDS